MSDVISLLSNLGTVIVDLQTEVAAQGSAIAALGGTVVADTTAITAMGSQLAAIGAQLANRGTVAAPGTVSASPTATGTVSATTTAAPVPTLGTPMPWRIAVPPSAQQPAVTMPADPGLAPYPSPDGMIMSTTIDQGGTVVYTATNATSAPIVYPQGVLPYIRDLDGAIWRITPQYNTNAYGKGELNCRINNFNWRGGDALVICQGVVYERDGGQYFFEKQSTGTGGDVSYAHLPPPWANGGTPFTSNPASVTNAAGTVLVPSPEYATTVHIIDPITGAETVSGAPYLMDARGKWELVANAGTTTLMLNGTATPKVGLDLMTVRQGTVYFMDNEGRTQDYAHGDAAWPAAFVPGTDQPPMPPLPPASPIVGGSSGRTLTAGAGMQYATINQAVTAAAAGDAVIVAPGTYAETLHLTTPILLGAATPFLVLDANSVPTMEADGITPVGASTPHVAIAAPNDGYQGKGAIVLGCDGCVIQDIEVSGAGLDQTKPDMCCGIRGDAAGNHLIQRVWSHANQMGIGSDMLDSTAAGGYLAITVENSVLSDNGIKGLGTTHNAYCDGVAATFTKCVSVAPRDAHCLKLRVHHAQVIDCITSGATNAANIDMPYGSGEQNIIQGGTHTKAAGSPNYCVISYGAEGAVFGTEGLLIQGATVVNDCVNGFVQAMGGGVTIDATSTITGAAPLLAWSGNTGTVMVGGSVVAAGAAIG